MRTPVVYLAAVVLIAAATFLLARHWYAAPAGGGPLTAEQGQAILDELRQVRQQLERLNAGRAEADGPTRDGLLRVPVEGRPSLGSADAPLTLVEFTDFQCPYCARFHKETFPKLKANFVDTGKLRYVVVDLPLAIHDRAQPAARAAHCAGEQGRYFEMHSRLFGTRDLSEAHLEALATDAGADAGAFRACMESGRHADTVEAGLALASRLGLNGTPSFVIGRENASGVVVGQKVVGALPYEVFEAGLNRLLARD